MADSAGEGGILAALVGGERTSVGDDDKFGDSLRDAENCAGDSLGDLME